MTAVAAGGVARNSGDESHYFIIFVCDQVQYARSSFSFLILSPYLPQPFDEWLQTCKAEQTKRNSQEEINNELVFV